jgi:hypothetical protein
LRVFGSWGVELPVLRPARALKHLNSKIAKMHGQEKIVKTENKEEGKKKVTPS